MWKTIWIRVNMTHNTVEVNIFSKTFSKLLNHLYLSNDQAHISSSSIALCSGFLFGSYAKKYTTLVICSHWSVIILFNRIGISTHISLNT